jgi:hypothetical protein
MASDQVPATQADLRRLEASLVERIDTKSEKLHDGIDQVLAVLSNMDKRLAQNLDGHESRIRRLENQMGLSTY